ncbi:phenylacetic acid degradation protein [Longispora fulva]|uniref:Ring-1,2-phenylacetyl-CoA epoxidase subunit PaaE n=1 Tax=Longispora fulva TaxID=619741 RepID=A0A8J7GIT0_9ACTN|nr:1,2-phenylacetyl-CoA epoxidase subunit PaaE [Longispora fulva]MBG6140004.1 ring-1,2-phenylacetyl-CoA epoxidase subunit PaaE [Longispora fulva]GIG57617.1 phenylacetic acid degradation protein [Longispora fulva]
MTVTLSKPARRRPVFHPLLVQAVDQLTDDAVAVSFRVPDELRSTYAFRPGQHLTVRLLSDGEDIRRSYSICSTPGELERTGLLRVGVKQVPGGAFSTYANGALDVGHTIEVMPPIGHFTTEFQAGRARRYVAVVAGSGITPVLSLLATGLAAEPESTWTVLYGNRYARSVMFLEELADLKDRYPSRVQLVHVLSREPQDAELLSGRIDAERLPRLLAAFAPEADEYFLCGPYGMVVAAQGLLDGSLVHSELFYADDAPSAAPTEADAHEADVTIVLDGRATSFGMRRDEKVLDAALKVRSELPYACKGGVCSTCKAKVVEGEVAMARNYALEPDEVAAGFVLTCQSSPVTDRVVVDYDA